MEEVEEMEEVEGETKEASPAVHVVKFQVGLPDMSLDAFDDEMRASFTAGVAAKLGVGTAEVNITASAGSINVEVKVSTESADAASAVAASAQASQSELVDESVFGPCVVFCPQ